YPDAGVAEWLQSVTLASGEGETKGGVSLMTLHMSKGLEFPRVFIVGVEEGLLPHRSSMEADDSIEEERRLFYVGMTRAKERLSLLSAYRRRTYNNWAANRPSRFLSEIPKEYLAMTSEVESSVLRGGSGERDGSVHYSYEADDGGDDDDELQGLEIGSKVRHPTYGVGLVEQVVDEFSVIKAVVRFHEFGLRKVAVHHLSRG
ncbi:hypothetical protein E3A20_17400, partial [Planctomyces bekefii]